MTVLGHVVQGGEDVVYLGVRMVVGQAREGGREGGSEGGLIRGRFSEGRKARREGGREGGREGRHTYIPETCKPRAENLQLLV